jgi:hypothetical protein
VVLDKIEGFDWDYANVGHVARHAVTPFEVEEVTTGKYVAIQARTVKGERRWKLFGMARRRPGGALLWYSPSGESCFAL